ncbi:hypothetical protein DFH09DRAFT_1300411 [Mycena vulgaris]|nr:hypothetical protein DFH09DRAFT_1300411 [Mycena vulgaris]
MPFHASRRYLKKHDPDVMARELAPVIYDDRLHAYYRRTSMRRLFVLATVNKECCAHLNEFSRRLVTMNVPGDSTDLLATLPWELLYPLIKNLPLDARVRLSQTSRRNYALSSAVLYYAVDDILKTHFGLDYAGVRMMQSRTGCMITGSLLPAVFHAGSPFIPNDLDFCTPFNKGWYVCQYLQHSASYILDEDESPNAPYSDLPGLNKIFTLRCGSQKINVLESRTSSARDPVFGFHSSPVMATLCPGKGWLSSPKMSTQNLALVTRYTLPMDTSASARTYKFIHKYLARGFQFVFELADIHACGDDKSCPSTMRSSADGGCANIYLPPSPFGPWTVSHETAWSMGGTGCSNGILSGGLVRAATNSADRNWLAKLRSDIDLFYFLQEEEQKSVSG